MKFTKITLERSYFFLLLIYSGVMLIVTIFEAQTEFILTFPLYFLLPGYAFIEFAFPQIIKIEKALASVGLSIALFVGINAFIQTFQISQLFSELTIVIIVTILFLIAKLSKITY